MLILEAIIIIVVILVIGNVLLYIYNKTFPICCEADDYIESARCITDDDIDKINLLPNKFKVEKNTKIDYDEITLDDKIDLNNLALYEKINQKLNSKSSTTSTNSDVEFQSSLEDIQVRPKEKVPMIFRGAMGTYY